MANLSKDKQFLIVEDAEVEGALAIIRVSEISSITTDRNRNGCSIYANTLDGETVLVEAVESVLSIWDILNE